MEISVLRDIDGHARALRDLFKWADAVDMACAWATAGEGTAEHWQSIRPEKIRRAVIGVQFSRTEPWVLRTLLKGDRLRIGQAPRGTFHPKLYLGIKGARARAILGSANFTSAAFSSNVELSLQLSGDADDATMQELVTFLDGQWSAGKKINKAWLDDYGRFYEESRRRLPPESPLVSGDEMPVTSIESLDMSWEAYYQALRNQEDRAFGVIRVFQTYPSYSIELSRTRAVHRGFTRLADVPPKERRLLMGLPGSRSSGLIGSMQPARHAKQIVKRTPEVIGAFLDRIPYKGEVPFHVIEDVVGGLMKIRGVKIGVATRLLAVKRPDLFVSVNSGSKRKLSMLMGKNVSTATHYIELLKSIWELGWYRAPPPVGRVERLAWRRRAALLDAILYEKVQRP